MESSISLSFFKRERPLFRKLLSLIFIRVKFRDYLLSATFLPDEGECLKSEELAKEPPDNAPAETERTSS